jgi:hypothetical protein
MNLTEFQKRYLETTKSLCADFKTVNPFEATEAERSSLLTRIAEVKDMVIIGESVANLLDEFSPSVQPAKAPPGADGPTIMRTKAPAPPPMSTPATRK